MSTKKASLTKNSIFYLIYNVLNIIFPFVSAIYVARILSQNAIGNVSYALNIATYFVILAFVGIPTYGMREVAKVKDDQNKLNKIFTELVIINACSTIISLIAYSVLIFAVPAFRSNYQLFLIGGVSILLNLFNVIWLFDGLENFKVSSIFNLITKVGCFLILVLLVRNENGLLWYALATALAVSGNYLTTCFRARKFVKFDFKGLQFKRHFKPIFFLMMVNLAIEIYSLVDVTMLGMLCEKETVAIYKYAIQIQKTLLQVVNTFTMILIPRITTLFKEKKFDEFNTLISKTLGIIIVLSLPMIVGIYFTSDALMVLLYGESYAQSANVLKLMSLLLFISPIGYLLGSRICLVTDNEKYMPIAVGIGALVNIAANYIFINMWKEMGAATASVLSEIIVAIIYISLGKKYFKLKDINSTLIATLMGLALMSTYLIFIKMTVSRGYVALALEIAGGVLIYGLTLIFFKEPTTMSMLNKIKRKLVKNK